MLNLSPVMDRRYVVCVSQKSSGCYDKCKIGEVGLASNRSWRVAGNGNNHLVCLCQSDSVHKSHTTPATASAWIQWSVALSQGSRMLFIAHLGLGEWEICMAGRVWRLTGRMWTCYWTMGDGHRNLTFALTCECLIDRLYMCSISLSATGLRHNRLPYAANQHKHCAS